MPRSLYLLFFLQDTLLLSCVLFFLSVLACSFLGGPGVVPFWPQKLVCFLSFLSLETSIGVYFPSVGCLRSRFIPESHRATITNWFRVPMNLLTCGILLSVNHPAVVADKRVVFGACSAALAAGAAAAEAFRREVGDRDAEEGKKGK